MIEPKRRGRPALDTTGRPSERVQVSLAATDYDAAARLATSRRETLQDLIRRSLARELNRKLSA